MRFAIAIAVLVLSGITLILGIGQRTFLAPPSAVVYTLDSAEGRDFAVIPAEVFDAVKGQATVTVQGADAFAATGANRDVDAWVKPFDHVRVSIDPASKQLVSQAVAAKPAETPKGEAQKPADGTAAAPAVTLPTTPQGSDLWIQQSIVGDAVGAGTAADQAKLSAFAMTAERSVIVATGGEQGLDRALSITWTQDQRTPWAGPLLVGGGILALVGGVLYLLAVDHNHRGLGPRRGRKGPLQGLRETFARRRRTKQLNRVALPALAIAGALALSGCSANYWPDFSAQASVETAPPVQAPNIAPVPILNDQIDRIIADVVNVADQADETLDAELLKARFTGDALVQRTASYKIRKAVPDYALVPPHLTNEKLGYTLVQSTQSWPRTMLIALASDVDGADEANDTADDAATPSLALVLTQAGPHENYLVSRVVSLRGSISMPEASPAEEGTALLADDLQTLVLPPGQVAAAFAAVLQNGTDAPEASSFTLSAEDSLVTRSGKAWVKQSQDRAAADGYSIQYSVTVEPGTQPATALSVSDGGALVAVTVVEQRVSDTAGSTTRVRAEGAVSALSGLSGQQTRLVNTVAHQLLFYVPSKVSHRQIELLGATSEMVGASN